MSSSVDAPVAPEPAAEPPLSPLARATRIFTDPAAAWPGLRDRPQFQIPLLLTLVVSLVSSALLYSRAVVPMQIEQMERQVVNGQMPPESFDRAVAMMDSPMMLGITLTMILLGSLLFYLIAAGTLSFGVGFVLGGKLRYRLAFETVTWAGLVTIPGALIHAVLAWFQETMDVRLSPAVLLPAMTEASKLEVGLISFLQWLGPFSIWFLVVTILGASALSGAPRKNVAWVVAGLYLAFAVILSAVAMMFATGA